jgi:tetratricopeptide (TPR) repeat protein
VKAKARDALVRAGDRAESLGAIGEAQRYLEQAAALTDAVLERASLLDRAGWKAQYTADWETAERLLGESIALYESEGDLRSAARVSGHLASIEGTQGRMREGVARGEAAFATLEQFEPGTEFAELAGRLAMGYVFLGEQEKALAKADLAIELSESLGVPEPLARAFLALSLAVEGTRPEEGTALLKQCLAISREHGLYEIEYNALFNLSDVSFRRDRYEDALTFLADALAIARRRGSRTGEWGTTSETCYPLFMLGRWDEMFAAFREVPEERLADALTLSFLDSVLEARVHRGEVEEAARVLSLYESLRDSTDVQNRMMLAAAAATIARAEGRLEDALRLGVEAAEISRSTEREASQGVKQGLVEAIEAALALGDAKRAEELVASIEAVPPGLRSRYLGAQALRFRARLSASDDAAFESFDAAAKQFRELEAPFWLAVTQLEHGERLVAAGQASDAEPRLAEAREIFGTLEATPWLERVTAAAARTQQRIPA